MKIELLLLFHYQRYRFDEIPSAEIKAKIMKMAEKLAPFQDEILACGRGSITIREDRYFVTDFPDDLLRRVSETLQR